MTESLKNGDKVRLTPAGRAALKYEYEEVGPAPWQLSLKGEVVIDLLVPPDAIGEVRRTEDGEPVDALLGRVEFRRTRPDSPICYVIVCWPSGWVGLHEPNDLELVSAEEAKSVARAHEGADPRISLAEAQSGLQGWSNSMDKDVVKSRILEGDDYARGYERGYNDACRNERAIAASRVARERERGRRRNVLRQLRQERRQSLRESPAPLDLLRSRIFPGHRDAIDAVRAVGGEKAVRALYRRHRRIYVIAGPRSPLPG